MKDRIFITKGHDGKHFITVIRWWRVNYTDNKYLYDNYSWGVVFEGSKVLTGKYRVT